MYPVLFRIGNMSINTYGFMIAIGIIAAILIGIVRGKRRNMSEDVILDIAIYGVLGGVLGAKLLYIIVEWQKIFSGALTIKDILVNGFVVYGGIIGGVLTAYIYCRIKKIKFMPYFDLLVPSVAIAQGFGRIGCLCAGCCYGAPAQGAFSIVFQHSPFAPNGVPLYPTQIMSSLGDFAFGIILILFARKKRKDGQTAGLYLILYSIGRFLIEFLRGDERGSVFALSTSQFICIFIIVAGIAVFNFEKIRNKGKQDACEIAEEPFETEELHEVEDEDNEDDLVSETDSSEAQDEPSSEESDEDE